MYPLKATENRGLNVDDVIEPASRGISLSTLRNVGVATFEDVDLAALEVGEYVYPNGDVGAMSIIRGSTKVGSAAGKAWDAAHVVGDSALLRGSIWSHAGIRIGNADRTGLNLYVNLPGAWNGKPGTFEWFWNTGGLHHQFFRPER